MKGEYDLPIPYSQIIHTWNIGLPETSSTQLLTNSKIQKSKCKLHNLLIGVGIFVIFVTIALTAAILLSSEFKNLMEKLIMEDNLTTENIASSSIIDTEHPSSRNTSSNNIYHGSGTNDAAEDQTNQIATFIPTINESTIDDKGRYRV